MPLVVQTGPCEDPRYFKPEVVSALEKRLLQDMQSDKDNDNGREVRLKGNFAKGQIVQNLLLRKGKVNEEPEV
jgi:hypothetical protein